MKREYLNIITDEEMNRRTQIPIQILILFNLAKVIVAAVFCCCYGMDLFIWDGSVFFRYTLTNLGRKINVVYMLDM